MDSKETQLEQGLKAIAEPNRLEILRQLQEPRTIDAVRLTPSKLGQGIETRRLTREAVRHHLTVLSDLGLVRVGRRRRDDGRLVNEFQAEPRGLYQLLEQLHDLCACFEQGDEGPHEAIELGPEATPVLPPAPRVVILHGLHPGEGIALRQASLRAPRGWVIGASSRSTVSLPYDPFVSPEDAEILPTREGFQLMDLRGSKNRVSLNGKRLDLGASAPLQHGDVIRVGRSWLVFHAHDSDRPTTAS